MACALGRERSGAEPAGLEGVMSWCWAGLTLNVAGRGGWLSWLLGLQQRH